VVSTGIVRSENSIATSITLLAGIHVGCFELFAKEGIRSIADLKGRTVGIQALETSPHIFLSAMATLVGLDPAKDIEWATNALVKPIELFAEGKIDAFLGFPPDPQRLRAQNIGHVIVNSAQDRPWSQYFCCMLAGNREFVRKNPIATKRAVRASNGFVRERAGSCRPAHGGSGFHASSGLCGSDSCGRTVQPLA
jgi:NitT/TauT family transport system substrate-binding protein